MFKLTVTSRVAVAVLFLMGAVVSLHGASTEIHRHETRELFRQLTQGGGAVPDHRVVSAKPGFQIEELRGAAAYEHLMALKTRKRAAFAKVASVLAQRGFKPTNVVFVQRQKKVKTAAYRGSSNPAISLAQSYSESSSEGEITLWSWDDGYDGTWEGAIYMEIYGAGGGSCTGDGQVDISTENPFWYYTDVAASEDYEDGPLQRVNNRTRTDSVLIVSATRPALPTADLPYDLIAIDWDRKLRGWSKCTLGGCTVAAVGCLAGGPGWAGCWGAWCTGTMLGCVFLV